MKRKMLSLMLSASMVLSIMLPTTTMAAPKPAKVQFTQKTYYVPVGKKYNLGKKLRVFPGNAKKGKFTWKSSKKKIATVNKKGVVKATKKVGKTKITVKSYNGRKAVCTVYVVNPVKSLTVNHSSLTLTAGGKSSRLSCSVAPKKATIKKVTWMSSNPKVAQVSSDGTVTPIAAGHAVITATSVQSGKQASCSVTVKSAASSDPASTHNAGGRTGTGGNTGNTTTGGTGTGGSTGGTGTTVIPAPPSTPTTPTTPGTSGETGGTTQPSTPTNKRTELLFNYNHPKNSAVTDDEHTCYGTPFSIEAKDFFNYVSTDLTFTIPSVSETEPQYTFEGWTAGRAYKENETVPASLLLKAGDQVTVKNGETVTLYALWRKNAMKKVTLHMMPNAPSSSEYTVSGTKYAKYYKTADGSEPNINGYAYFTVDGVDYIRSDIKEFGGYEGPGIDIKYSKFSGINTNKLRRRIQSETGLTLSSPNISSLEFLLCKRLSKRISNISLYPTATAFIQREYSVESGSQGMSLSGYGTLSPQQTEQCCLIWASEVDSWCEENTNVDGWHMGFWDYCLWGDTHFTYGYTGNTRGGVATGVERSDTLSGIPVINGVIDVYEVIE